MKNQINSTYVIKYKINKIKSKIYIKKKKIKLQHNLTVWIFSVNFFFFIWVIFKHITAASFVVVKFKSTNVCFIWNYVMEFGMGAIFSLHCFPFSSVFFHAPFVTHPTSAHFFLFVITIIYWVCSNFSFFAWFFLN